MAFFVCVRFNFTISYHPDSSNLEPVDISGQYAPKEDNWNPETLPALKIEEQPSWGEPDPGDGPTNWSE